MDKIMSGKKKLSCDNPYCLNSERVHFKNSQTFRQSTVYFTFLTVLSQKNGLGSLLQPKTNIL